MEQPVQSPIIELTFYKNPVFICITLYTLFIIVTYMNMNETVKNSYVFGDKFRNENGDISWTDLYLYPYDYRKSTLSVIYGFLKAPFTWYAILFHLFTPAFFNLNAVTNMSYFRITMFSYLLGLVAFVFHIILFGLIWKLDKVDLESKRDNSPHKDRYKNLYRVQWIFLLFLSPIYVCIFVYLMSKI